jgi:hypothetical protein
MREEEKWKQTERQKNIQIYKIYKYWTKTNIENKTEADGKNVDNTSTKTGIDRRTDREKKNQHRETETYV